MTAKSLGTVTAFALLMGGIGFAWFSIREARRADAALAGATRTVAQADARIQHARSEVAGRQQEASALQAKVQTPPPAKAAPRSPIPAPPLADLDKLLESEPKLREEHLKQFREFSLPIEFRLMYQRLGLTPEQIEKFEALAVAHEEDLITLRATAKSQGFQVPQGYAVGHTNSVLVPFGVDPVSQLNAGLAGLVKQSDEQFHAAVARELGPEVGVAVAQNHRITDAQTFVMEMDFRRVTGASNLTTAQATQVAEILLAASPSYQAGGPARLDDMNWEQAFKHAAAVLPPAQFQVMKARADFYKLGNMVKDFRAKQVETKR